MKVQSSNIDTVDYSESENVLTISFLNGSVYKFFEVPQSIFNELINAPSVGGFFNKNIKNIFNYKKIS